MKKLMKVGCSALILATLVAGCGSKDDGKDKDQRILKFDSFSGGNGEEVWKEMAAAFEKANPDVKVEMRFENDLPAVLQKDNATGNYSDLVYYNVGQKSGFTESQLNSGEVMDISDVFEKGKDIIDPAYADCSVSKYLGDGKNYLAPIMFTPGAFFYNADNFGEGKYTLPTTWDEMFALGDELKAKSDSPALFTYPVKGYFDNTLIGMYQQLGILDKALSYDEGTWTSEQGKKILETVGKLVSKDSGYLFKDTVSNANAKDGYLQNQQAIIDNKALFMPNGYWVKNEMGNTTPKDFKWGVMALPAFEKDGKRAIASFTEQAWIPAKAKNADDAKKFLSFIYSEEGAKIMLKYNIVVPIKGVTDLMDKDSDLSKAFATYGEENVESIVGASYAAYNTQADNTKSLDFNASLYGPIDEIANGTKDVAAWQSELVKLWATLKANPVQK